MVAADKDNLDMGEVMITLNRLWGSNKKSMQSKKKVNHVFKFYQDYKLRSPTLRKHDFHGEHVFCVYKSLQ